MNEMRVVMVGKWGVGKSAVGNSLLKKKQFNSNTSPTSVTSKCKYGSRKLEDGTNLIVVDTPGFFHTHRSNMDIAKEVVRCIRLSIPGPHAFFFVSKIGARFTAEERDTIQSLKDIFGKEVMRYVIVVFTGKDILEREEITLDQYIGKAPPELIELIAECNGRFVAINNRAEPDERERDIQEIFQVIRKTMFQNGGKHYTGEIYEAAEEAFKEKLRLLEEEKYKREQELDQKAKKLEEQSLNMKRKLEEEMAARIAALEEEQRQRNLQSKKREEELARETERLNNLRLEEEKEQRHREEEMKQLLEEKEEELHKIQEERKQEAKEREKERKQNAKEREEERRRYEKEREHEAKDREEERRRYKREKEPKKMLEEAVGNTEEMRVVMVGKTGVGKSSLGNSLLKENHFFYSTLTCKYGSRKLEDGTNLIIVDTPGIFDTSKSNKDTSDNLVRCIGLSSPGPHAFFFVLKIGAQFTAEERDTIQSLKDIFGTEVMRYVIVVFTGKDNLEEEELTLDEYIGNAPPELIELIAECNGRFVAINNRADPDERERDIQEIFQVIRKTMIENGGKHYTGEMYEQLKKFLKRKREETQERARTRPNGKETGRAEPQ